MQKRKRKNGRCRESGAAMEKLLPYLENQVDGSQGKQHACQPGRHDRESRIQVVQAHDGRRRWQFTSKVQQRRTGQRGREAQVTEECRITEITGHKRAQVSEPVKVSEDMDFVYEKVLAARCQAHQQRKQQKHKQRSQYGFVLSGALFFLVLHTKSSFPTGVWSYLL